MKKQSRKLKLTRETLAALVEVRGGASKGCPPQTQYPACGTEPTSNLHGCNTQTVITR